MDPGLAALFGSLVGGAVVLLANYRQASLQNRQVLVQRAAELAAKEYGHEITITEGTPDIDEVAPLANYIVFYHAILSELGSRRGCSVNRIQRLRQQFELDDPAQGTSTQQRGPANRYAEGEPMQPANAYLQHAQRLRAIIEAKENFVWATTMKDVRLVCGIPYLGEVIVAQLTDALHEPGLLCYPNPLPVREQTSVLLMLDGGRFAQCFQIPGGGDPRGSEPTAQET